ncbi:Sucrose symporter plant [Penicillium cataractarum]|uniref:Sucrose symporter plant n=1 Tax=Penicillium cataractarum TaxID=2100454 RepID=A0A9W9V7Z3_9EURO|nr:Sucrose symporter plant [Penicillium cataractarum]KAJ5369760.1 Sucrose symporter plant [Penicillium cataractarum]
MSLPKEKRAHIEANMVDYQEAHTFYPIGPKLILITISLMLAVFCVALDNTIMAVAIPRITDDFHALNDVGWYASSYLLTTCSFQLLYGKFYTLFQVKWVYLSALFLFELGSLICGVAPNSTTLIVGRAVAGLGSAGMFTGALVTLAHTVEVEKRPIFFSMLGGMYGIASVAGPLLGGAFTDHATWRWCFYINLPLGGITAIGLLTLLKLPPKEKTQKTPMDIFLELDPIGTIIFVPAIVCLLLALQWGGVTYEWSSGRIIALFVVFGVALIAFVALQIFLGYRATVPPDIARQRTIAFASLFGICIGGSFFIMIYYVPIWFQAIRGVTAVRSGIDSLPMILSNVAGIIISGALTTKFGYNAPFFIASSIIMSIGAGLITTFTVDVSQAKWVGYLFIYGLGVGLGFQQGGVAAQAVLPLPKVSIGTAIVMFLQMLGGSLFVSVAQNIFTKELIGNLEALKIPDFFPSDVVDGGATSIRALVSESVLPEVLVAYNNALLKVFQLALILGCLSVIGALGVEWKNMKKTKAAESGEQ